jgi:hypothetical protein
MNRMVSFALALIGCSLVGCAALPADQDVDETSDAVPPPLTASPDDAGGHKWTNQLAPPGTEWQLGSHGNPNGGSGPTTIGGGIIYAVSIFSGNFVDSMQLAYYIPTHPDNQYHAETNDWYGASPRLGGGGGNNNGWTQCPGGFGVVGVQGRANAYVDALGIICASLSDPNQRVYLQVWGGPGGNSFLDDCGVGSWLTSFAVKAGTFVDWEQSYCRRG